MDVIVVDTSSWISYLKGNENDDLDSALQEGRVYLSPVVLAELVSGKMEENKRSDLVHFLRDLPLCLNDFDHWLRVGIFRANLLSKGLTVSTPDAHVAQCALDLKGYLMSEDLVFKKIKPYFPKLGLLC